MAFQTAKHALKPEAHSVQGLEADQVAPQDCQLQLLRSHSTVSRSIVHRMAPVRLLFALVCGAELIVCPSVRLDADSLGFESVAQKAPTVATNAKPATARMLQETVVPRAVGKGGRMTFVFSISWT